MIYVDKNEKFKSQDSLKAAFWIKTKLSALPF